MSKQIFPGAERKLENRAGLRMSMSNSLTMAYRSLLLIRRKPEQLFDVTVQPILFTLMFTFLFGGAIAGSVNSYLPILIPGILVQTVITGSTTTGVQLREDMDKGVFNRFKSMPISRIAPLAGALLADTIRYGIATSLTFVMGYILGYRWATFGGALIGGLLAILSAWCVSWIFAFLGTIARTASTVQGISAAILFPLTFLSSAYVPTSTLPGWLQSFVNVNPVTYLVDAIRQLLNQGTIGNDFLLSIFGMAAIVAIFAPLAVRAYLRKA
jgi:ABC-2 type transport system permease protein